MIRARAAWCTKCNAERPALKTYPFTGARRRTWVCVVCRERMDLGTQWSAAKPTKDVTGKTRASKAEANRGTDLWTLAKAGAISNFRMCNDHPRETFALVVYGTQAVDALLEELTIERCPDCSASQRVIRLADDVRRSRQTIAHYTPDFSYDDDRGVHHVEDVKGRVGREYPMKKRLMLAAHGIEIEEPDMRREPRSRKRSR